FSLHCSAHHRDLPSFPTRRSSDLAAVSSALPPISPIITIALVSSSSLNSRSASRKLVPMIGSPPMPMQVDWPIPRLVSCPTASRSEEHTSELQSRGHLVCRLLLEK